MIFRFIFQYLCKLRVLFSMAWTRVICERFVEWSPHFWRQLCLERKSAFNPVIKRKNKNKTKEFIWQNKRENLVTCGLEAHSEVITESPTFPRHSQTKRLEYDNVFNYHSISSPNCRDLLQYLGAMQAKAHSEDMRYYSLGIWIKVCSSS